MTLSRLHMRHFRSYDDRVFEFQPGTTIISGPNGSGKTNILEAIHVLATGKSFRDHDEALLQYDQEWWQIQGVFSEVEREVRFKDMKKEFYYEGERRGRFSRAHRLPVVLFEPDDLLMVHGSPSKRRAYIDHLLSQVIPSYGSALRRYERALAQRNRVLKQQRIDKDSLFVWDITLAEEAEYIAVKRDECILLLNEHLAGYYSAIAGSDHTLEVSLVSITKRKNYKQSLIHDLEHRIERDKATGFTSVGPHRDDIEFYLDGKHMATNASRGEIRTLVLALKRYEIDQLKEVWQTPPLFLLDDVFSELDKMRQQQLVTGFYDGQTIITTTESDMKNISQISLV